MRYRRRPVERDTVDAIYSDADDFYFVARTGGKIDKIAASDFELDYEPVKRERKGAVKRARKVKVDVKTDAPTN